jgi:VIT1/CCC1 family predicted Fe2+/Mn2+ transporter
MPFMTDASPAARRASDLATFARHWRDEADAAYLYRVLTSVERDPSKRSVYQRLAAVEDRHTRIWADLLTEAGRAPGLWRPSATTRLRAWAGRRFGPGALLPMLLREEGREVLGYLAMHRATMPRAAGSHEALVLARESAEHAATLAGLAGIGKGGAEPWHRHGSGGLLRSVVYGFNDGLTANFGLVAGVLGAATAPSAQTVIVAGVAGLIADALSMGASGYLAAKSAQEVNAHEIAMERDEIATMPDVERDELALRYEARGVDAALATEMATQVMADPRRMLDEQVREELGIGDQEVSPLREGVITGIATGIGAFIPVLPFLMARGPAAAWVALAAAMLTHFLVGAARAVFTGRGAVRSGLDMFAVGLGVAGVGYFIGGQIGRQP